MLRGPLEQFSSAKYAIGGTLDEPDVNLVSVFDTSIDEPAGNGDSAAQQSEEPLADGISSADDEPKTMNDNSEVAH